MSFRNDSEKSYTTFHANLQGVEDFSFAPHSFPPWLYRNDIYLKKDVYTQ